MDDSVDTDRVNCVLTSLYAHEGIVPEGTIKEEGVSKDIDIADIVAVSHAARFVKPAGGIEIVVSVCACLCVCVCVCVRFSDRMCVHVLPQAKLFSTGSKPSTAGADAPIAPEVFSFQWPLSAKIRTIEDTQSA